MIAIAFSNMSSPVQVLGETTDDEQIKGVVQDYFQMLYEARKTLVASDFSQIATTKYSANPGWLAREKERQEIERAIAKSFNQSILKYEFKLDFQSVEMSSAWATVNLYESNSVWYSSSPEIASQMGLVKHVITLIKINNHWMINNDQYEDEMTQLIASSPSEEIFNNIGKNSQPRYTNPMVPHGQKPRPVQERLLLR